MREADSNGLSMQGGARRRMRLTLILNGLFSTQVPRSVIDSAATVIFRNPSCAGRDGKTGSEGEWRRNAVVAQLTTDSRRKRD